jgi:putative transposase
MHNIDKLTKSHQAISKNISFATIQDLITDTEIEAIYCQLGYIWRQRLLPPTTMVRSMIYRSIHKNRSIKTLLTDIAAANIQIKPPTDAAWCRARSKLPAELWPRLIQHSEQRLTRLVGHKYLYHGIPVFIVDGSTVSMPDEPQLVKTFGYADTKHGLSRFPVARITFLVRLGVQAVCGYEIGRYRTSEDTQFNRMWPKIPNHSICLFDKKFCSFYNLTKLQQRHIFVVTPLHQKRKPYELIKAGKRIGNNQWIVFLQLAPQLRKRYKDKSLPLNLPVRMIRVKFVHNGKFRQMWLVTTLLDHIKYSGSSIIRLYRQRWEIETRIGSLKTTLQMKVLQSKKTKNVYYEVAATVLAHNLVWTVIHQASQQAGIPAERISFIGAARTILAFSIRLQTDNICERHKVYTTMLYHIAGQTNSYRPNRSEPRLIKRQTRSYGFLKISRRKINAAA